MYPPPPPTSSQLTVLTNPFPHQGYVDAQPTHSTVAHQPLQSGNRNYQIIMVDSKEINL